MDYRFMRLVSYASIQNWSVQYTRTEGFGYSDKYPLARIGSFLRRSGEVIEIADDEEYKQVTVRTNNGGVCLRDTKKGKDIGTKRQIRVSEGQYVVSKIDARNGAFGIIPKELNGAVVTNDFPVFDVDNSIILTEFLLLVTTTKQFIAFAQSCSSGTTNRRRINIDLFLSQRIPLPTLDEQRELVDAYNQAINESLSLIQSSEQEEELARSYIASVLGIEKQSINSKRNKGLLQFIHFREALSRWDTYAIKEQYRSNWPIVKLGELITSISTGTTPPTSHKEYFGGDVCFYTPADISGEMYLDLSERHLTQKALDDNTARTYEKGTILFVGIGSTVGKVGIVNKPIVSSNQQITGFMVNPQKVLPEYIFCFLNYNKDISTAERAKTTLPIVNQTKIAKIPVPLPPLEIQASIVARIKEAHQKKQNLKDTAANIEQTALQTFEKFLFT